MESHSSRRLQWPSSGCPPSFQAVNPANSLEHDKGTLRASGGRKAYRSWKNPTWLGFRMSFNPAADFSNSSLLTPEQRLPLQMVSRPVTLQINGIQPLKKTTDCSTTKVVKRRMPRARKARVRLRRQNKTRAHVARNN